MSSSLGNLKDKQSEFMAVEESVGISWQQFRHKFVFNSNSGPDLLSSDSHTFYIHINQPSPSQLHGLTKHQQNLSTIIMSELIFKAGEILKLPVSTTLVSANIAHYYFTRKSFLDYDFRDIAMGATFLACKSEQTLRRSYQVAAAFDYIFKMYQGIRPIKELELNSNQYNYIKQKVLQTQNQLLFELGFEVYKLFDIPHRYISGLITSFNKHKQCNAIVQHSWTFLNDIYRTKAPVHFPGQMIAAAALFMALQKLSIPLPDKPWWILMEASLQQIKQICILTNQMYTTSNDNQVNINIVSEILEKAGKSVLKVSNLLPVPYYRKIRLDNQGLIMKSIEIQKPISLTNQKPLQQIGNSSESEEDKNDNGHYKEKSKKEKKKDKKKHKNHQSKERSKSRSQSKENIKEKGKYQNDEETPKIIKTQLTLNQGPNIKVEEAPQRKASQGTTPILAKQKNPLIKNSVLLDAKSMLSKLSSQFKKIQAKNEAATTCNDKKQEAKQIQNGSNILDQIESTNKKVVPDNAANKPIQAGQDSDEQDELLAQLIQIKKKNLQKKDETKQ